ncbi:MAG: hypothetical protein NC253_10170 [Ruminococcus sp.]|nr:hypothetical protein [Ruminococcus sp.]MCM1480068.1 hypothetical protein [Muribaculaceae bacterium]
MNTVTVRILVFLLSLFILITVFYQISIQFQDSYVTETAVLYSSAEKVSFQGVYIRNETPVYGGASGVLSYPNADGSKIANGSVVAYVYNSENDIYVNQQIEKLKEEVALLESAQNPGTTEAAQPEFISSLIDEEYQTIAFLIAEDDLDALAEERKQLQTLMNIYKIIINEETDYNGAIDSLNSRIEQLEAERRDPIDSVSIDSTGYFISYTDGFESKLSLDNIDALTADDIKDVISGSGARNTSGAIGKMVDGYEWKMAGIVDPNAADFRVGSSIKVKFASTPDRMTAVIEDLIQTDVPNESVIVLSCDKLTYNLVQRRVERVELILNDYDGIRVPREAIRFNDKNEKGVYILLGQRIAFRKIEPVYECEEYILSEITSDADYVSVYDDIIVEGEISEDLYVPETSADEPDEPEDDGENQSSVSEEEDETETSESSDAL